MQAFISKKYLVFILSCAFFLLNGCQSYKEKEKTLLDTPDRGLIHVSADESFKPIIDEQVKVYELMKAHTLAAFVAHIPILYFLELLQ